MGRDTHSTRGETSQDARRVTFLGRGLALRSPDRLTLLVCPLCSQRNGERMAALGICVWCGYEPSARDERPCGGESTTRSRPHFEAVACFNK